HSAAQNELRMRVRAFVRQHILPVAAEFDRRGEIPEPVYRAFFETGLLHGYIPRDYGGAGHDAVTTTVVAEELAYGCVATAAALVVAILPITIVMHRGTEEQKARFLAPLARRFRLPAIACTELEAGGDLRSIQTRAVRCGSSYVLSGQKTYISNLP